MGRIYGKSQAHVVASHMIEPYILQANRNRTYQVLYDNNIGNNLVIAGDSHANWVSDLVWLDHTDYDPTTGAGAVGVEFGGTAVSSSGYGKHPIRSFDFIHPTVCCTVAPPFLRCPISLVRASRG